MYIVQFILLFSEVIHKFDSVAEETLSNSYNVQIGAFNVNRFGTKKFNDQYVVSHLHKVKYAFLDNIFF